MTKGELCSNQSTTPTCQLLHEIEQSLDETINPCENFYGHICNRFWSQHNQTHYQRADHQMSMDLINVMETLYPRTEVTANQSIFDKAYIYYKSCLNEGESSVLRYFDLVKPGQDLEWPLVQELKAYRRGDTNFVVPEWPEDQFDVYALLGQLQSYGLKNVLIAQILTDADSVLIIARPEHKRKSSFTQSQLISLLMDWGLPEEKALQYAEDVMDTETYWYSLYQNSTLEPQNEFMSYRKLKQKFPYLSVFLDNTYQHPFRDTYRIDLYNTAYFQYLQDKSWSAKEAQDISNYLMLLFFVHLQEHQASGFAQLRCIRDARSNLELPLNLLYYQHVYKPHELVYNREIYTFFNKTLHYVRADLLENNMNLSASVLHELATNMSAITLNMGNLPRNLRSQEIEKFFGNIPALELHSYHKNHLHLLRHQVLKSLLPLRRQTHTLIKDPTRPEVLSSTPFYDHRIDMVILPFSVIQPPIYHHTYDPIFKWSNLGHQLALGLTRYVLSHVFKLEAGINQPEYTLPQLEARAVYAAGFLSIQVAYKAYINEQRSQLQPDFTTISWQKLFFLNLAQQWCGPPQSKRSALMSRIFQIAIQLDIFKEAFQCS